MTENKGLSAGAYGGVSGDDYVPYVPVSKAMPEMTVLSIFIGIIFAIVFGAANTYLGLKVGMTIAAGIPGAILATGILKGILRRNNILEANMIQAMASMGESLAGGLIFIIPAVIIFGDKLTIGTITVVAILGSLLGILFVVPLRRYLIVEEHGKLVYPEGMAAAEVLVSSSAGGSGFKTMMTGVAGGGIFKFLSEGLLLWKYEPEWTIKPLQGTIFGADVTAALIGVGYIVGIEIGMYMFAGALVAWLGLIPLIKYIGAGLTEPLFPSAALIKDMDAWAIWSKYIRYVGAGAVIAGGFISIAKAMPTIARSFKSAMSGIGAKASQKRTDVDVPMTYVIAGAIFVFIMAWLFPMTNVPVAGAIFVIIFAFFFSVVSARLVGMIGTSNNPISGMTISSLLFITGILKLTGHADNKAMVAAIIAGGIVCVAIAIAGGTAQSLKTTFIIGGTPKNLEIGMFLASAASAAAIGYVILMLNSAYGIGSKEIPAPQATMMSMVVKGIMTSQLPWTLVLAGISFGVMCELMGIPILPFALGLYLPIHLSAGVVIGGIVRAIVDKKFKDNEEVLKEKTEKGVLLASGMVAGESLVGILLAVFAMVGVNIGIGEKILPAITSSPWTSAVMGLVLCYWIYSFVVKKD
ncbi:OPT family oligopeptide transporter [Caloramator sp. Dgby_cultured_2]|uniref:OPT family oligopeptide transporter n=1 Tax=Caloramator sp. Dgby_cultured_2 TaxID=3029174 RepID=UPI00237E72D6|nr:oligopeptide transporter, OPT family [Caloramator sp. Dgby_cultured_2]WDU81996.1 oligopeptide transporter, OPT family [Caloramator sp. Dgby_cultured_2]